MSNVSNATQGGTDPNTPQPIGGYAPNYQAWRSGPIMDVGSEFDLDSGQQAYRQTGPNPRYLDGSQFAPMSWDINAIIDLQQKLHAAGLLGKYRPGVYADDEITAYTHLLAMANGAGASAEEYLNYMNSTGAGEEVGGDGNGKSPLVVKLKNDDDLRAVLQSGAQALFGKYLDQGDIDKFISNYHAQETQYQTSAYEASGYNPDTGQQNMSATGEPLTGTSTTLTGPPSTAEGITNAATRQMFADKPTEAGEAVFSAHLNQILSALSGRGQ